MLAALSQNSALLKRRQMLLFGEITIQKAEELVSQAIFLAGKSHEPISLHICSPGGMVSAGLAILDALQATGCTIKTFGFGVAASMAAVLLSSGTPGHRYLSRNGRMLIHSASGGCFGTAPDVERQHQELQRNNRQLIDLLAEYSGRDSLQVGRDIERDLWLTPTTARDYGLIDHILSPAATTPQQPHKEGKNP